jgi:hypothetical protein
MRVRADPSMMKTDGTTDRGVALSKEYLEFAKAGVLDAVKLDAAREPHSDFERSVSAALRLRSLGPVPQIGVAKHYIDLGIRRGRT